MIRGCGWGFTLGFLCHRGFMIFIDLLRPLLLLHLWEFLKQVACHLVADWGKFGLRGILPFYDDFGLMIDFLVVALPLNINDPYFARFLDGRPH